MLCSASLERLQQHRLKCPMRPTTVSSAHAQTKFTIDNTGELYEDESQLWATKENHKMLDKSNYINNDILLNQEKERNKIGMTSISDIVKIWLDKIPPCHGPTSQEDFTKTAAVKELTKNIMLLENTNIDDFNYESLIGNAADHFLSQISIQNLWYPGTKKDKELLKFGLKKYLIHKLLNRRKKYPLKGQMLDKRLHTSSNPQSNCDNDRPVIPKSTTQDFDTDKTKHFKQRTSNYELNTIMLQESANKAESKTNTLNQNSKEAGSSSLLLEVHSKGLKKDDPYNLSITAKINRQSLDIHAATMKTRNRLDNNRKHDPFVGNNKRIKTRISYGGINLHKNTIFKKRSIKEIEDWLSKCTFLNTGNILLNKPKIIDALLFSLRPYFNQPYQALYKADLKRKIINILKQLNICSFDSTCNKPMIYCFADNLANTFMDILFRLQCTMGPRWHCNVKCDRPFKQIQYVNIGPSKDLKRDLLISINKHLQNTCLAHDKKVKKCILELFTDNKELIRNDEDIKVKLRFMNILNRTNKVTDSEIKNNVENSLQSCKVLTNNNVINSVNNTNGFTIAIPCLSGTVSIFTSKTDMTPSFEGTSSTPKKRAKNERNQLNAEQQAYTKSLKEVIKSWVDSSPPHFKYRKDSENMTELMVEDLSAEICDHFRLEQITNIYTDKEQIITFYIYKWLLKYEIVEDLNFAKSYTNNLVHKIHQITVPNMTKPQHGNRQDIGMIKQAVTDSWTEPYHPKVKDLLEDEISIFVNEYPSEIFVDKDKTIRGKTVHEFAEKIQPKLVNAESTKEVQKEVYRWMHRVVEPRERDRVDDMAQSLINRLKRLPHDEAIAKYVERIKEERTSKRNEKLENQTNGELRVTSPFKQEHNVSENDYDKTMTQFVAEYIKHYYVEEDPLTKKIYLQILKSELNRLNPYALKNVYETKTYECFNSEKLYKELLYIKEVSDWLKTLPLDSFYNTVENKDRAEFVTGVAKNILEVEEERQNAPYAMDYDLYLAHNVADLFGSLPILPTHTKILTYAINDLLKRLAVIRAKLQPIPSGQNIMKFFEEFLKKHGSEMADDKLRLEAWSARLYKEFKKILIEGKVEEKEALEQRLRLVPKPGDDSVRHFNLELDYAREIIDWLKNLELRGSFDESNIEELAYKMADERIKFPENKNKRKAIIDEWVKRLPLNENENVHIPILTMQLVNRIEKVTMEKDLSGTQPVDMVIKPEESTIKKPADIVIETIENWCKAVLPTNINPEQLKEIQKNLEAKIIMKVSELNSSSLTLNSDLLYTFLLRQDIKNILVYFGINLNDALISQLVSAIETTRPLFIEEKAKYAYNKELENVSMQLPPTQASRLPVDVNGQPLARETIPQFQRDPSVSNPGDLIETWNSNQSGAQFLQQNVPVSTHVPFEQYSPISRSPLGVNVQHLSPQDSPLPQTLPQIQPYPPLALTEDTISSWNGATLTQRNSHVQHSPNESSLGQHSALHSSLKQRSTWTKPKLFPYPVEALENNKSIREHSNIGAQPGQDTGLNVQHLPQMKPYPPLSYPEDSISPWNSNQSGAKQNVSVNVHIPPTQGPHPSSTPFQIHPSQKVFSQARYQAEPHSELVQRAFQPQPSSPHLRPEAQGPDRYSAATYTDNSQPPTRNLGVNSKPIRSEAGVQTALQYLPLPPCLRSVESLNIQRAQNTDINCDCDEHSMEGLEYPGLANLYPSCGPAILYPSCGPISPCFSSMRLWMHYNLPPCLRSPPFNLC